MSRWQSWVPLSLLVVAAFALLLTCWARRSSRKQSGDDAYRVYRPPVPGVRIGGLGITLRVGEGTLEGGDALFVVELSNLSQYDTVTVAAYVPSAFDVRMWDSDGRELTDITGYDDSHRVPPPRRCDWVTIGPQGMLQLRRGAVNASGLLTALPPGSYRAAVTLSDYRRLVGDRIPDELRARRDDWVIVWTPPEAVDNVAEVHFRVGRVGRGPRR
jgi:hypothetical protein